MVCSAALLFSGKWSSSGCGRRLGLVLAPQARYLVITLALAQQARQELVRRFRRRLGPKRVHDAAFEDGQG